MSRVEIPVEAKLNAGDIDAELKQLTQKINALGQSIAKANQVKFNPITKASLDDIKRMNDQFEKLKRTSQLGQDLNRTGQGGKSFLDLDWNSIAANSIAREARRYGAFNRVLAGSGASFTQAVPSAGGGAGGGTGGGVRRSSPGAGGSPWGNAGRKVVSSGLNAAGPAGGVADEAISTGASGGIMAGVAGLIGGVVALGVGKLVGGVMNKVGDAQQDSIGYDTLKRTLGDVNVSFSVLQRSMHAASDAFDGTYQQTQKMAGEFVRISGISGKKGAESLANEVAIGGGFGRSFGVDPEQSNAFFAQMRQFGVTGNDRDSKRLALYVGEAIAKSGSFAKTDEMLQAIASYTTQQTRMGLVSANAGDYTAMLTSMVGAKVPGGDVIGAAGLLSRVNSSIASGGNAGEAGQNFMYMAVGRQLGLSPIMGAALREQGAFGTGQQEFGSGSVMAQWAALNNVNIPAGATNSTATNMSMIMGRLHSTYANNPELRLSAMQNLFGTNINQSAFLDMMKPTQMGDVMSKLASAGIDTSKMNPTAISSLAQVAIGSRSDMNDATKQIWSRLNPAEQASLDKAQAGGDESLRNELLKDFAKYGQSDTEGSQTREKIQALDKDMMEAAGKMIGPLNQMRDVMLYAFGDHGRMSSDDIHKAIYEARKGDIDKKYNETVSKAQSEHSYGLARGAMGKNLGDFDPSIAANNHAAIAVATGNAGLERGIEMAQLNAEMYPAKSNAAASPGSSAALPAWSQNGASASPGSSARSAAGGKVGPSDAVVAQFRAQYGDIAAKIGSDLGVDPNAILAQIAQESNWGRSVVGGNAFNIQKRLNWLGATQMRTDHSPDGTPYQKAFEVYGSQSEMAEAYEDVVKRMDPGVLGAGKNTDQFTRGLVHHLGWAEDPSYAAGINGAYARLTGTPMPDTGSASPPTAGPGGMQSYSFDYNITLQYPNGQPAASPFSINTSVGGPVPFGN